jgi:hypothetical protein
MTVIEEDDQKQEPTIETLEQKLDELANAISECRRDTTEKNDFSIFYHGRCVRIMVKEDVTRLSKIHKA